MNSHRNDSDSVNLSELAEGGGNSVMSDHHQTMLEQDPQDNLPILRDIPSPSVRIHNLHVLIHSQKGRAPHPESSHPSQLFPNKGTFGFFESSQNKSSDRPYPNGELPSSQDRRSILLEPEVWKMTGGPSDSSATKSNRKENNVLANQAPELTKAAYVLPHHNLHQTLNTEKQFSHPNASETTTNIPENEGVIQYNSRSQANGEGNGPSKEWPDSNKVTRPKPSHYYPNIEHLPQSYPQIPKFPSMQQGPKNGGQYPYNQPQIRPEKLGRGGVAHPDPYSNYNAPINSLQPQYLPLHNQYAAPNNQHYRPSQSKSFDMFHQNPNYETYKQVPVPQYKELTGNPYLPQRTLKPQIPQEFEGARIPQQYNSHSQNFTAGNFNQQSHHMHMTGNVQNHVAGYSSRPISQMNLPHQRQDQYQQQPQVDIQNIHVKAKAKKLSKNNVQSSQTAVRKPEISGLAGFPEYQYNPDNGGTMDIENGHFRHFQQDRQMAKTQGYDNIEMTTEGGDHEKYSPSHIRRKINYDPVNNGALEPTSLFSSSVKPNVDIKPEMQQKVSEALIAIAARKAMRTEMLEIKKVITSQALEKLESNGPKEQPKEESSEADFHSKTDQANLNTPSQTAENNLNMPSQPESNPVSRNNALENSGIMQLVKERSLPLNLLPQLGINRIPSFPSETVSKNEPLFPQATRMNGPVPNQPPFNNNQLSFPIGNPYLPREFNSLSGRVPNPFFKAPSVNDQMALSSSMPVSDNTLNSHPSTQPAQFHTNEVKSNLQNNEDKTNLHENEIHNKTNNAPKRSSGKSRLEKALSEEALHQLILEIGRQQSPATFDELQKALSAVPKYYLDSLAEMYELNPYAKTKSSGIKKKRTTKQPAPDSTNPNMNEPQALLLSEGKSLQSGVSQSAQKTSSKKHKLLENLNKELLDSDQKTEKNSLLKKIRKKKEKEGLPIEKAESIGNISAELTGEHGGKNSVTKKIKSLTTSQKKTQVANTKKKEKESVGKQQVSQMKQMTDKSYSELVRLLSYLHQFDWTESCHPNSKLHPCKALPDFLILTLIYFLSEKYEWDRVLVLLEQ